MSKKLARPGKPGAQPVYRNKPLQEHVHDSYRSRGKLPEPTLCPQCGAVFHDGRWQWLSKPEAAHREMCPACHRIHDRFPAGFVKLEGDFLAGHRAEVINLVHHIEKKAKAEHPLQRIMEIVDEHGAVLVTTTDIHLAHGIGEAVRHAYQGHLESHYNPEENLLRIHWKR
ncbi:MAG: ATPase [Betaproteobacteria bacterium]|nr:ATPase [Betaproteobacteria bacterium]